MASKVGVLFSLFEPSREREVLDVSKRLTSDINRKRERERIFLSLLFVGSFGDSILFGSQSLRIRKKEDEEDERKKKDVLHKQQLAGEFFTCHGDDHCFFSFFVLFLSCLMSPYFAFHFDPSSFIGYRLDSCLLYNNNNLILENVCRHEGCVRCMVINEKHANILQYKESKC